MSNAAERLAALKADAATVQGYAAASPARRRGRPLLLAFAAMQRIDDYAESLAALGRPLPTEFKVPAVTRAQISAAMGRVATNVAALPSMSRACDLPAVRRALEIAGTPAKDRTAERAAVLARAATVAMGQQRHGLGPMFSSLQALFRAVGEAHGCSAPTVRRAWQSAGGQRSQFVLPPRRGSTVAAAQKVERRPDRSKVKAAIDVALRKNV
jgi:hypothetical protein